MSKRKVTGRSRRQSTTKPNMVAAAVELAGGVSAVARLCGVTRQSVYSWIEEWRVERLIDALKISRASGIPVEKLAGEAFDESKEGVVKPPPSRQKRQQQAD